MSIGPTHEILLKNVNHFEFQTGWRHWVHAGIGMYHEHPGWELVYHAGNKGSLSFGNKQSIAYEKGDITLSAPKERHMQQVTSGGEDLCIVFMGDIEECRSDIQPLLMKTDRKNNYVAGEFDLFTSSMGKNPQAVQGMIHYRLRALLATLLWGDTLSGKPQEQAPKQNHPLFRARKIIDEFYTDKTLAIADIAQIVGISTDYLRHGFQTHFGISPKQYMMQLRMKRVKDLLMHSNLTLKEISKISGFSNERYLCFYFHQIEGIPPGEYKGKSK